MDREASSHLLSWALLPVSAVLVLSALSLPQQPYTGVVVRGDWVAEVLPGSPGERAGLQRDDRLLPRTARDLQQNPLAGAAPGVPLPLLRERGATVREITLVPSTLPDGERRIRALLLAVASGFVVLGGWVWSERRDRLTRTFYLVCLAFAWFIAPWPRVGGRAAYAVLDALYSGVSVVLPALFVHFFALFPESDRPRGALGSLTTAAYGVAAVLFAASLVLLGLPTVGVPVAPALAFLNALAGLWFAAGLVIALVLFTRSYRRARSSDARRRLRVALAGTILGVGPLAMLVLLRNLSPGVPVHGERVAVVLTLLVPASFAWATAVHRIFEIRIALRAAMVIVVLAVAGALVYALGEWLAAAWRADLGAGIAGGGLAFVAVLASVAGPAGAWLRQAGERFVPVGVEATPAERLTAHPAARHGSIAQVLEAACEAVVDSLKLDGCLAMEVTGEATRLAAREGAILAPALEPGFPGALAGAAQPVGIEDARVFAEDRAALEAAGVSWLLPVGEEKTRAVLFLGRRLAGPWLSIRESRELARFAAQLEVLVENAALRDVASAHGAMGKELSKAGAIQARLLPRHIPAYRSLDCAAAALSSEAVGGDYYDFVRGADKVLTLAVGDAAGKGVPAALMAAWGQASFRNQARRAKGPGQVLAAMNRDLVALDQPEAFVALLCARVEVRAGRLAFANAGLTPPQLRRRDGAWEEPGEGGVLLGVTPGAVYPDTAVVLDAGDTIVLHTDGLTEARRGDELFGAARLREVLDRHWRGDAAGIVRELLSAAQAFADHPLDDMTVVVLKQLGRPARTGRRG